jgi:hypothetical protein
MHAEKDHDVVVKDTETITIGEAFTSHNSNSHFEDFVMAAVTAGERMPRL